MKSEVRHWRRPLHDRLPLSSVDDRSTDASPITTAGIPREARTTAKSNKQSRTKPLDEVQEAPLSDTLEPVTLTLQRLYGTVASLQEAATQRTLYRLIYLSLSTKSQACHISERRQSCPSLLKSQANGSVVSQRHVLDAIRCLVTWKLDAAELKDPVQDGRRLLVGQ